MSIVAAAATGFNNSPFDASTSRYEVAVAVIHVDVSVSVDEAILTSEMADWVTDLIAAVNSETMHSMQLLRAGALASLGPDLTRRSV